MSDFNQTDDSNTFATDEEWEEYLAKFKKKRKQMFICLAIMMLAMLSLIPLGAIFGSPLPGVVSALVGLVSMISMILMFVFLIQGKAMQMRIRRSWRYHYHK